MFVRPGTEWLAELSLFVMVISIVLAIVFTVVTMVLELRKRTPDRLFRRWAVVTCVMWVIAIVAFFGLVSTFPQHL